MMSTFWFGRMPTVVMALSNSSHHFFVVDASCNPLCKIQRMVFKLSEWSHSTPLV